jgi:hypothetical protein
LINYSSNNFDFFKNISLCLDPKTNKFFNDIRYKIDYIDNIQNKNIDVEKLKSIDICLKNNDDVGTYIKIIKDSNQFYQKKLSFLLSRNVDNSFKYIIKTMRYKMKQITTIDKITKAFKKILLNEEKDIIIPREHVSILKKYVKTDLALIKESELETVYTEIFSLYKKT